MLKELVKKIGDILLEDEARAYEEVMKILNSKIKEEREQIINKILAEDIDFPEKKNSKKDLKSLKMYLINCWNLV